MNTGLVRHCLECWGDYAFFGNSIYGANRRSYEFPTPASVIGIFESVYWKPCFKWVPDEIQILSPIKYTTLMRNELRSRAFDRLGGQRGPLSAFLDGKSESLLDDARDKDGEVDESVLRKLVHREASKREMTAYHIGMTIGVDAERIQRCDKILRDVRYRFIAHIDYDPSKETEQGCNYWKHVDMFDRRAKKGQCFSQPYFGCREFPAFFRLVDLRDPKNMLSSEVLNANTPTNPGIMHYGFKWDESSKRPIPLDFKPYISGGRVFISAASCRERLNDAECINVSDGKDVYIARTRDAVNEEGDDEDNE